MHRRFVRHLDALIIRFGNSFSLATSNPDSARSKHLQTVWRWLTAVGVASMTSYLLTFLCIAIVVSPILVAKLQTFRNAYNLKYRAIFIQSSKCLLCLQLISGIATFLAPVGTSWPNGLSHLFIISAQKSVYVKPQPQQFFYHVA